MPVTIDAGDVIAGLAFLLSSYATWQAVSFNKKQKSLVESQEKLNNLLLEKENEGVIKDKSADLGASFAITPARLGLAYSPADTWQLIEKVGISRAKDLLMTGRSVNAEEALTIGLIDRLEEDVAVASTALGDHFAGLAPAALKAIKAITNGLSELSNRPDLQAAFEGTFSGAEFREGFRAFLEKRAPDFGGER